STPPLSKPFYLTSPFSYRILRQHYSLFFFLSSRDHQDLHSFPTRRSSDLATTSTCTTVTGRPATLNAGRNSVPGRPVLGFPPSRSEEHTSELQSRGHLVCRLLLEKKNDGKSYDTHAMDCRPSKSHREGLAL